MIGGVGELGCTIGVVGGHTDRKAWVGKYGDEDGEEGDGTRVLNGKLDSSNITCREIYIHGLKKDKDIRSLFG